MNYREIISGKILIDEYNIISDSPLIKNAKYSNLSYKKSDYFHHNKEYDNIQLNFSLEEIIISDIIPIENISDYYNSINILSKNEIKTKLQHYDEKKEKDIYKETYNYSGHSHLLSGIFNENSKYAKYLYSINFYETKINEYFYGISIYLYLNDISKEISEKIINNHNDYSANDKTQYTFNFSDNGLFYFADIIKWETAQNLKQDKLLYFTDTENPIYSLYVCKTDILNCEKINCLHYFSDNKNSNSADILIKNTEKRCHLFLISKDIYDNNDANFLLIDKKEFLSILIIYYNIIYNIVLSINFNQLSLLKQNSLNKKSLCDEIIKFSYIYFPLSRFFDNYETLVFKGYYDLIFFTNYGEVKVSVLLNSLYEIVNKSKDEYFALYHDVLRMYDIKRVYNESKNNKILFWCNILTLLIAICSLAVSIHNLNISNTERNKNDKVSSIIESTIGFNHFDKDTKEYEFNNNAVTETIASISELY